MGRRFQHKGFEAGVLLAVLAGLLFFITTIAHLANPNKTSLTTTPNFVDRFWTNKTSSLFGSGIPFSKSDIVYVLAARDETTVANFKKQNEQVELLQPLICNVTKGITCQNTHQSMSYKTLTYWTDPIIPLEKGQWFVKADEDVTIYPEFYELMQRLSKCKGEIQIWMVTMWGANGPYPHGPIYAGNVYPHVRTVEGGEDKIVGDGARDEIKVYDISGMVQDSKYNTIYNRYCYVVAAHGKQSKEGRVSGCRKFPDVDVCAALRTVGEYRALKEEKRWQFRAEPIESDPADELDSDLLYEPNSLQGYLLRTCVLIHEARSETPEQQDFFQFTSHASGIGNYLHQTSVSRALAERLGCKMVIRNIETVDEETQTRMDKLFGDEIWPEYSTPGAVKSISRREAEILLSPDSHGLVDLGDSKVFTFGPNDLGKLPGTDEWQDKYLGGLMNHLDSIENVTVILMRSTENSGTSSDELNLEQMKKGLKQGLRYNCPKEVVVISADWPEATIADFDIAHTVDSSNDPIAILKRMRAAKCTITASTDFTHWARAAKIPRTRTFKVK